MIYDIQYTYLCKCNESVYFTLLRCSEVTEAPGNYSLASPSMPSR